MARSDRGRPARALCVLCAVVALACAPGIPLERLRCPCLDDQSYRCCETQGICYRAEEMPAMCVPADAGGSSDAAVDAGAGGRGAGGSGGGGSGGVGSGGAPPLDRAAVDGYFPDPPAILSTGPWLYTASTPAGDWAQPGFDAAGWQPGSPGFFYLDPATEDVPRTPWPAEASDLWLRTTFQIDAADVPRAVLWGRWDDAIEVYVNGTLAAVDPSFTPGYRYLGLDAATLAPGTVNTLAVHAKDYGGGRYVDLAVVINEPLAAMPTSGSERTPELGRYATAVRQFMRERGIPGGVLAVMKKDQVVVKRAFGWADKRLTQPMPPGAVMRLGAPDVILTAGAVATLIDAGIADPVTHETITLGTRVFPLLRAHGLTPLPGRTPDPRIDDVTVRMLLDFESGVSEMPGWPAEIYSDLGVAPGAPITAADNARWVYSMPLAYPPGSMAGDGSVGHMLLRHLVHVVTGDLLGFLRAAVFAPAGSSDVFIAHEPLAARDAREPGYLTLEAPYDRWVYLDSFTALATTAEAFVRYLRRYHARLGTPLIDPETRLWSAIPDNGTHIHFGAMAGTWTAIVQRRHDEISYAVFFNIAGEYSRLVDQLQSITDDLSTSGSDSVWGL